MNLCCKLFFIEIDNLLILDSVSVTYWFRSYSIHIHTRCIGDKHITVANISSLTRLMLYIERYSPQFILLFLFYIIWKWCLWHSQWKDIILISIACDIYMIYMYQIHCWLMNMMLLVCNFHVLVIHLLITIKPLLDRGTLKQVCLVITS